jgi:putative transposase
VAHVLSRGNNRATVFHSTAEYRDFIALLDEARQHHDVGVFAFCIMPNHFHLVVHVEHQQKLSAMMQWWLTSHVRRYHPRHESSGHVWQGRFKSFPIQEDEHLLTVLRYVLLNPCRAQLVPTPWHWSWSSLQFRGLIQPWPVAPAGGLLKWLSDPLGLDDEEAVQHSIRRGAPFGAEAWKQKVAGDWGLEHTLRPLGRPKLMLGAESEGSETLDAS